MSDHSAEECFEIPCPDHGCCWPVNPECRTCQEHENDKLKMLLIVVTLRDHNGNTWTTAGEINSTVIRGNQKTTIAKLKEQGEVLITEVKLIEEESA